VLPEASGPATSGQRLQQSVQHPSEWIARVKTYTLLRDLVPSRTRAGNAPTPRAPQKCGAMEKLQNHRLTIRYDGRAYFGWQRHGEKPTLQGALEQAIQRAFMVESVVTASGRTDRGAHAEGQVAHALLPTGPLEALNSYLPADIRILEAVSVAADFHACYSAVGKRYRYEIWNAPQCPPEREGRVWHIAGPLDHEAMGEVCPVLVGKHDFASFATRPNFKQKSTVRTISNIGFQADLPLITLTFESDGFLYKMVRNLVRAIVRVGEGRSDVEKIKAVLQAKDRKAAPGTAPASGLFLDAVFYE